MSVTVVGVDIGNSTTEASVALIDRDGAVRYVGAPPVPSLRPHAADRLAASEAIVRATIAAEPPTSSAG